MELSPEEQSFFDAGEALDEAPFRQEGPAPGGHQVRRRSRSSATRRLRRKLRKSGWGKTSLSAILMIAAVYVGYRASMSVANRDVPSPTELGVESRPR